MFNDTYAKWYGSSVYREVDERLTGCADERGVASRDAGDRLGPHAPSGHGADNRSAQLEAAPTIAGGRRLPDVLGEAGRADGAYAAGGACARSDGGGAARTRPLASHAALPDAVQLPLFRKGLPTRHEIA